MTHHLNKKTIKQTNKQKTKTLHSKKSDHTPLSSQPHFTVLYISTTSTENTVKTKLKKKPFYSLSVRESISRWVYCYLSVCYACTFCHFSRAQDLRLQANGNTIVTQMRFLTFFFVLLRNKKRREIFLVIQTTRSLECTVHLHNSMSVHAKYRDDYFHTLHIFCTCTICNSLSCL